MANDSAAAVITDPGRLQGAARVGAELRGIREQLGWKLDDIAHSLRIRAPYLQAIESGELSALPGPAYQTGFVRAYAQALGLDAEEILRRFRAEGLGVATKAELSFLAPVPDRAVPTGAIVLLGVILLLVGYGLWYRHTEHARHLAQMVPSVPVELAPLAVPKLPTSPPAAAPKPPPPAATATNLAPPAQTAAAPASVSASSPAPAPAMTPLAAGKIITATADSWIEVRDPTGNILFSRVLHAGDSWPVPDVAGLTMTAGNAGATQITSNGKAGAPLGAAGTVVHNYVLTPPAATPATPPPQ